MRNLIPILGDQLSWDLQPLKDADPAQDHLIMMEVGSEARSVPHHPQKIALIFSAMRHFAEDARAQGWNLTYVPYSEGKRSNFTEQLRAAVETHKPKKVVTTRASEWRVYQQQLSWSDDLVCEVQICEDTRFIASLEQFADWAEGRKELRMEYFYRTLRKQTGLLMIDGLPAGGQWNFDKENRKKLPKGLVPPVRPLFTSDPIREEVLNLVAGEFSDQFGDLAGFNWPVTRAEALIALQNFVEQFLPTFGDYQDAMRSVAYQGDETLFHSLLAPAINLGLLTPMEVCRAAEAAYLRGQVPINAAEGFIRQILGWREYVRGLYWFAGPDYAKSNFFEADQPLPAAYWGAPTHMNCIAQTIKTTRTTAYAHHIQRLMITGNFALLLGVEPAQLNQWYLAVYADAFEWVQLPNTHGMALYADGGLLASKPYAASGSYIDRMSDYCGGCTYNPKESTGPKACPFNALYWSFLHRNRLKLAKNQRMSLIYGAWDHMADDKKRNILDHAGLLRKRNADL